MEAGSTNQYLLSILKQCGSYNTVAYKLQLKNHPDKAAAKANETTDLLLDIAAQSEGELRSASLALAAHIISFGIVWPDGPEEEKSKLTDSWLAVECRFENAARKELGIETD